MVMHHGILKKHTAYLKLVNQQIVFLNQYQLIDNFDSLVIKKGFLFLNKLKSVCL